jgi:hypothetical protein
MNTEFQYDVFPSLNPADKLRVRRLPLHPASASPGKALTPLPNIGE